MRPLDWWVLGGSLLYVILYGLWKSRGSGTVNDYLLAGRSMPWYAMALSIMATQASAITFISTTGQAYADGMRFVQFYFGLPLAMVILSATAVPIFHRAGVYTAYEYLERRFDARTRTLVSLVFLLQRGLAAGVALYAPAVVLTVIFGWPDQLTTLLMGTLVVAYTVAGGVKAVTWTDFQQMLIMMFGLAVSLYLAVALLPGDISLGDAVAVAGAAGKLNPLVTTFAWNDQYNLWSGLLGGAFLALAYFGTDQSQVQRYLTGRSVAQSRLSLLFNAVAKIPMQFLILFTGTMVFAFYTFTSPPMLFQPQTLERVRSAPEFPALQGQFDAAFLERAAAARRMVSARSSGDPAAVDREAGLFRQAHDRYEAVRRAGFRLAERVTGQGTFNDTNYVFLSFVTRYLPAGIVGLIMAMIFAAAMSTISAEVNSLATVTVIDVYRRHIRPEATDRHLLWASRVATGFWGLYAVSTAQFGKSLGSLIEAVNRLGSLFYGGMLGVFVLAFFFPRATARGAFFGVLAGEAAIFAVFWFTSVSFLWYNVIGCLVVVATGLLLSGRGTPVAEPAAELRPEGERPTLTE